MMCQKFVAACLAIMGLMACGEEAMPKAEPLEPPDNLFFELDPEAQREGLVDSEFSDTVAFRPPAWK